MAIVVQCRAKDRIFPYAMALAGTAASLGNAQRLAVVGLLGAGVDFLAFRVLFWLGLDLAAAHIASFTLAAVSVYLFSNRSSLAATRFFAVCLMALFLRAGALSVATDIWGLSAETAILFGIAAAAVVNFIGTAFYVFSPAALAPPSLRWRTISLGIVVYALALRLVFLASVNLLPEEAYYWNYAQHLDIGYLDHPPMVAWLIWAGTRLFGDTEFAVRLGAYSCWIVAAAFCFLLTRNLYGRSAAVIAVLLLAVLPFFFGIGMIMTPDAPLTAAWAAALYFLERALLGEQRTAWLRVGICFGLGLLSKYTIALLGPATILFMLLDPRSRTWFRRSSPYVAALAAAVLFSPVIIWNAQHDWASFMFQGPQRLQAAPRFSLFHLLASIMVLLTPVGVAAIVAALRRKARARVQGSQQSRDRRSLFAAIFTLAPLSVFVLFSLFHQVKLDWTGPVWLAMLPMLAADIARGRQAIGEWPYALRRTWGPTIAALLLAYGLALHYLTLGLPALGYSGDLTVLPIGWKEFGRQAALIEQEIESITGQEPLRVGTDKYFLSSQMAFYDPVDRDGAATTAGRSLFGHDSLMYDYWFPARHQQGQTIILFALKPDELSDPALTTKFSSLGPVREQVIYKRGMRAGRFFYRVGNGFRTG